MIDYDVALRTGMIAGLLMEAHMEGMIQFVAVPRVDADGFTNVIDLVRDGVVEFTVTVERAGPDPGWQPAGHAVTEDQV